MRTARMHGYNQPLVPEEDPTPGIAPNEVLLKVEAAGMCRTDIQMISAGLVSTFRCLRLSLVSLLTRFTPRPRVDRSVVMVWLGLVM